MGSINRHTQKAGFDFGVQTQAYPLLQKTMGLSVGSILPSAYAGRSSNCGRRRGLFNTRIP
ncbi:MAG: hypothetical protein ABIC18_00445 [Candidatus Omnitrophota bacterium]